MGIVIEFQKKKNLAQLRERVLNSIVPLHGITVREVLAQYICLLEQPIRSIKEQQSMYALTRGLNQIGLYMEFSEESQGLDTPAYTALPHVFADERAIDRIVDGLKKTGFNKKPVGVKVKV